MNNVRGMTLAQFNSVLDEMHSIYPFELDRTRIGELHDLKMDAQRQVEIVTEDEKTGITIVMAKGVDRC